MAALSFSLKKALCPAASASFFFLKHLNPIASSAHRRWFCSSSSSSSECLQPKYYSSSNDDDISDSENGTCHRSQCHRRFCSSSSSVCHQPKYYSSSHDDDISDSEIGNYFSLYHDDTSDSEIGPCHSSKCLYAYENPCVQFGSRALFELDMSPHEARVRVDLPGVDSSRIKVFFDDDQLMVRGFESTPEPEWRGYQYSIQLRQTELLKKEETRAEIQNGVLRVIIPKRMPQEEEEEEEENNAEGVIKVTGSITSPADVPIVSF